MGNKVMVQKYLFLLPFFHIIHSLKLGNFNYINNFKSFMPIVNYKIITASIEIFSIIENMELKNSSPIKINIERDNKSFERFLRTKEITFQKNGQTVVVLIENSGILLDEKNYIGMEICELIEIFQDLNYIREFKGTNIIIDEKIRSKYFRQNKPTSRAIFDETINKFYVVGIMMLKADKIVQDKLRVMIGFESKEKDPKILNFAEANYKKIFNKPTGSSNPCC